MLLFRMNPSNNLIRKGIGMIPDNAEDRQHLMESGEMAALIHSLAEMICNDNRNVPPGQLILIGIQRGGVPLAERLVREIRTLTGRDYPCGMLDIAMYRDDIGMRKTLPRILETRIPFDITGKTIVLVDDVLQSGRSIRAALDAVTYYGRPAVVRLAVLLDRGNREFPIQGDYVGKNVSIQKDRRVRVNWQEITGTGDFVYSASLPNIKETL